MKKTNNKGFSLVELIVVIAIMGVLMVVLAPQYLKYVEKSRLQKDNSALAEIANNIKIALADETVANEVGTGTTTIASTGAGNANKVFTFSGGGSTDPEKAICAELASVVGDSYTTSASTYNKAATGPKFIVQYESGIYRVYGDNIIGSPNDTSGSSMNY